MNYLNIDCKAIPSTFFDKDGIKHDYIKIEVKIDNETFRLVVRDCDKSLFKYLVNKKLADYDEE